VLEHEDDERRQGQEGADPPQDRSVPERPADKTDRGEEGEQAPVRESAGTGGELLGLPLKLLPPLRMEFTGTDAWQVWANLG
jgi:hypothetical protein